MQKNEKVIFFAQYESLNAQNFFVSMLNWTPD